MSTEYSESELRENALMCAEAKRQFDEQASAKLVRGFFGSVRIEMNIEDGVAVSIVEEPRRVTKVNDLT